MISKRAVWLILVALVFSNGLIFAAENIQEDKQKIAKPRQQGLAIRIKLKENKNWMEAVKLLNAGKYEEAIRPLEVYLLSEIEIFDQLIGLGMASLAIFPSQTQKGVDYFKNKIDKNQIDYRSIYNLSILKIAGLSEGEETINNLKETLKSNLNSAHVHYLLGLAYLLNNKKELYLNECDILEKQDAALAKQLRTVFDQCRVFQEYLKDRNRSPN